MSASRETIDPPSDTFMKSYQEPLNAEGSLLLELWPLVTRLLPTVDLFTLRFVSKILAIFATEELHQRAFSAKRGDKSPVSTFFRRWNVAPPALPVLRGGIIARGLQSPALSPDERMSGLSVLAEQEDVSLKIADEDFNSLIANLEVNENNIRDKWYIYCHTIESLHVLVRYCDDTQRGRLLTTLINTHGVIIRRTQPQYGLITKKLFLSLIRYLTDNHQQELLQFLQRLLEKKEPNYYENDLRFNTVVVLMEQSPSLSGLAKSHLTEAERNNLKPTTRKEPSTREPPTEKPSIHSSQEAELNLSEIEKILDGEQPEKNDDIVYFSGRMKLLKETAHLLSVPSQNRLVALAMKFIAHHNRFIRNAAENVIGYVGQYFQPEQKLRLYGIALALLQGHFDAAYLRQQDEPERVWLLKCTGMNVLVELLTDLNPDQYDTALAALTSALDDAESGVQGCAARTIYHFIKHKKPPSIQILFADLMIRLRTPCFHEVKEAIIKISQFLLSDLDSDQHVQLLEGLIYVCFYDSYHPSLPKQALNCLYSQLEYLSPKQLEKQLPAFLRPLHRDVYARDVYGSRLALDFLSYSVIKGRYTLEQLAAHNLKQSAFGHLLWQTVQLTTALNQPQKATEQSKESRLFLFFTPRNNEQDEKQTEKHEAVSDLSSVTH